ncbi:hypothetical protein [Falsarthrobacter nasiphocae]|uniref:Uncharacterized protein n=1 Tax=Falsarthrobacter nasiphocae TaxID=189863 RepID=A0AAE3YHV9_9MICC|nr:hypothetical protein [Falsarthrobacter nasiphocae]MDR6892444.1 hypothetical protein [Falsarthrobacter nasiphocae]
MRQRRDSPSELLDGALGFLAAFALGLTLLIGWSILTGRQSPGPSLVLLALVLGIWALWGVRRRLAARQDAAPDEDEAL